MTTYRPRLMDQRLEELLRSVPAVSVEGARAVGKTRTARAHGTTFIAVDDPDERAQLAAIGSRFTTLPSPLVIDEWQRMPELWDRVRRAVDDDPSPGRFLLTGSSTPSQAPTHTGAGRIITLRMRPFSLAERAIETPTVSVGRLLGSGLGTQDLSALTPIEGYTSVTIDQYVDEICRSGFPAIREQPPLGRKAQLDGYIEQTLRHDLPEATGGRRRSRTVREWLTAYASAVATTASFSSIAELATRPLSTDMGLATARSYRDHLSGMWLLDPVPGWSPSENEFSRNNLTDKHQLCDPALAARLLGYGPSEVLGVGHPILTSPRGTPRRPRVLGSLFESLVIQSLQVYAEFHNARVFHLRTKGGLQEIDIILEGADRRVVAFEIKARATPKPDDTKHLRWLRKKIGPRLAEAVLVTTGHLAYRDEDGIAVVPAALLGP